MTSRSCVGSSNVLELGVLMEVLFKDELYGLAGYLSKNRCNLSQFTILFVLLSKCYGILESALFPNGSYILNICLNGEKYFNGYFISFSLVFLDNIYPGHICVHLVHSFSVYFIFMSLRRNYNDQATLYSTAHVQLSLNLKCK